MTTTTLAGTAGRLTGHAVRGLLWAYREIDWGEAWATGLAALQVAIVLALLAGRLARRGWDALPVLSERLGRWYARLLVGPETAPAAEAALTQASVPALRVITGRRSAADLQGLTRRQLQQLTGCRRNLPKRDLIALALAAA